MPPAYTASPSSTNPAPPPASTSLPADSSQACYLLPCPPTPSPRCSVPSPRSNTLPPQATCTPCNSTLAIKAHIRPSPTSSPPTKHHPLRHRSRPLYQRRACCRLCPQTHQTHRPCKTARHRRPSLYVRSCGNTRAPNPGASDRGKPAPKTLAATTAKAPAPHACLGSPQPRPSHPARRHR